MAKKSVFDLNGRGRTPLLLLLGILVLGVTLNGCSTLIALAKGTNKKASAAAETFVGKSVEELLTVDTPTYVQTAGKVENYAFYHWVVRQAAGEEGVKPPAIYARGSSGELMVIFTCTDGVVKSYKLQADQSSYFGNWTSM